METATEKEHVHPTDIKRIDQLALADKRLAGLLDLLLALLGQRHLGGAGVLAAARPLGLAVPDQEDTRAHSLVSLAGWNCYCCCKLMLMPTLRAERTAARASSKHAYIYLLIRV